MKKLMLSLFLGLSLLLISEQVGRAQASDQAQRSEQVMGQLLNEVRLLRQDLLRLTTSTYRSQAIIERLKLQQEQVTRLSNDLGAVRNELAAAKSGRAQIKEKMAVIQQRIEIGAAPSADLNSLKTMLEDLDQREPDLGLKESQLSGQLNIERSNLEELYKKLDAIDAELQSLSNNDKTSKPKPQE